MPNTSAVTRLMKRSYSDSGLETSVFDSQPRAKRLDLFFADQVLPKNPALHNRFFSRIMALPTEIYLHIFRYVNPTLPQNIVLQTVCRSFFYALQHNVFWEDKTPRVLARDLQGPGHMYRAFVARGAASPALKALYNNGSYYTESDICNLEPPFCDIKEEVLLANLWDMEEVEGIVESQYDSRAFDFTLAIAGARGYPVGEGNVIRSFWAEDANVIAAHARTHADDTGQISVNAPELFVLGSDLFETSASPSTEISEEDSVTLNEEQ